MNMYTHMYIYIVSLYAVTRSKHARQLSHIHSLLADFLSKFLRSSLEICMDRREVREGKDKGRDNGRVGSDERSGGIVHLVKG